MSFTQTPNYSLYKPTINADNDQWGTHLNANADTLDSTLQTISNTATGAAVTISDTAPATPAVGALWFDSVGTQMYLRYNDGNSSQWVPATNQNVAIAPQTQTNVGRNLIMNPYFNVAQRGAGPFSTLNAYSMDRWKIYGSTDTFTVIQTALGDVQRAAIGDEAAKFCFSNTFTGNAAAGAYHYLGHPIEDVRRLAGKTVTVSFWANASASLKLGINLLQTFGTGGSPSAAAWVLATGAPVTLATAWARYTTTIAMPSASGKTLGTNGDDNTQLAVFFSSGSAANAVAGNIGVQSGSVNLWGVQLEVGSVASPLEKIDPRMDLANCQRFFYSVPQVACFSYGLATALFGFSFSYPTMRIGPAIGFSGTTYTNAAGLVAGTTTPSAVFLYAQATANGSCQWTTALTASADL